MFSCPKHNLWTYNVPGLCGAVHTGVSKVIRADLSAPEVAANTKVVCVGDKSRNILQRLYGKNIMLVANEVRKCSTLETIDSLIS